MKRILMIILIVIVQSCDDDDRGDRDCVGDPNGIAACPDVLDPVCGCNGITYDNSCEAEASGVKLWTKGKCN
jgi:hypothetical protein